LHLYHCHVGPLAEHIARGMYGAFIVDPRRGRAEADELVMVMNGFNTNFDAEGNQLYAVNSIAFHHVDEPVKVRRNELVRIYVVNILEYDPINSLHIHGNFFDYFPTGTRLQPVDFTDTIMLGQGQRGICELRFPHAGRFMFHAHKSEFADLGWMGFFEVS
jgi:FtsP/CotA-like multicopper oxidase with cupredoxin domain